MPDMGEDADWTWWDSLPTAQQRLVAQAVVKTAVAHAKHDGEQAANIRQTLTRFSQDLCGDADVLPDVFDRLWEREQRYQR